MTTFDFAEAHKRTGWDRRVAATRIGVSLGTVDRALDAGKWSDVTERRYRAALHEHMVELAPFALPAPGQAVLVPIRLPDRNTVLQVRPFGVSRLHDAGRLCLPESRVDEALVELHGSAQEGLDDTVDGREDAA